MIEVYDSEMGRNIRIITCEDVMKGIMKDIEEEKEFYSMLARM